MKRFVALLIVVILVAGLWSGGWLFAASQVRDQVAVLASNDGQSEPKLTCSAFDVTGFPFRFDLTCSGATLVSGDVTASVAGIKSSMLVYNPTHVLVSALSPISVEDAFTGSESRLDFTGLQGSVHLTAADLMKGFSGEGWRIARVSLVGDGLNWVDTIAAELPLFSSSHAEIQLVDIPERHDKVAGVSALAAYVVAKDAVAPLYGITTGNGELQAEITGLPDDLRIFAEPDILQRWQSKDGRVNLVSLKGTDGPDMLDVSGSFGIDAAHMLTGDVTYSSMGIKERLRPYVPFLILEAVAGFPQPDGSIKQALQFANGSLLVGGVPLMRLEPLF